MKYDLDTLLKLAQILIWLGLLLVSVGRWSGRLETKRPLSIAPPEDDASKLPPGRVRDLIATLEQNLKDTRALAHDARNIANVTKGEAAAVWKQMDRDMERIDRSIADNTRRIDELWRVVRSSEGV